MIKIKKTSLWSRLKAAVRAFAGKPTCGITIGLEVKRCDECEFTAIVHCKDCLFHGHAGTCRLCDRWRDRDDFCSLGLKKEGTET